MFFNWFKNNDRDMKSNKKEVTERKYKIKQEVIYIEESKITLKVSPNGNSYYVLYADRDIIHADIPSEYEGIIINGIYKEAFKNCTKMVDVSIPKNIKFIGEDAFRICSGVNYKFTSVTKKLEKIYYVGTIDDWCQITFANGFSSPLWSVKFYLMNEDNQFYELEDLCFTNKTYEIKKYVFYGYKNYKSIRIPVSIKKIGDYAFTAMGMRKELLNFYYEGNIEDFSKIAFGSDSNPMSIADFTYMLDENGQMNKFEGIYIPKTIDNISDYCFKNNRYVKELIIPDNIKFIGIGAFSCCKKLEKVLIPNSVKTIKDSAFDSCNNLKHVNLPESLSEISFSVFSNCASLKKVEFPKRLKYIGDMSFNGCESLTEIIIPDNVTSIGGRAFSYCYNLTNIILSKNLEQIGDESFSGCKKLEKIILPNNVKIIGIGAFSYCDNLTNIILSKSLEQIGDELFSGCKKLGKIILPNNIRTIGKKAFRDCKELKSIIIPSSIDVIDEFAFLSCDNLTNIVFEEGLKKICYGVFDRCINIDMLFLPSSLTYIGNYAFRSCEKLESIVIPKTVTFIGKSPFDSCYSLKNIFFEGTEEDWYKIVANPDEDFSKVIFNYKNKYNESLN